MKKKVIAAAALGVVLASSALAQLATEGPWMVRARAVHLSSANDDGTALAGLSINNKWIPEVDVSYFFTPNIAAELILTVPQKHTMSLTGVPIGSLKHLPPTLTLQYHFTGMSGFKPYLGAGVNYTRFSGVTLPAGVDIKRSSWGAALQAGVDIPLSKGLYLNFDVKKVYIGTTVYNLGVDIGKFKVDPVLFGMGLGWRF